MRAILGFAKENQVPNTLHVSEMTYEMDYCVYFRKSITKHQSNF